MEDDFELQDENHIYSEEYIEAYFAQNGLEQGENYDTTR